MIDLFLALRRSVCVLGKTRPESKGQSDSEVFGPEVQVLFWIGL